LKINQLSRTSLLCMALSHGIFPSRSLKGLQSSLQKSRVVILLFALLLSLRILASTISWSLQSRLSQSSHLQPVLPCKCEVQQTIFPAWLLSHLCQAVVIDLLQTLFGLLVPCCVAPPADNRVVHCVSGLPLV